MTEWEGADGGVVGRSVGGALSWDADWSEGGAFRRGHERGCGCGGGGRDGVIGGRRLDGGVGNVRAVAGLGLELGVGVVVVELRVDAVFPDARRGGDDYGGFSWGVVGGLVFGDRRRGTCGLISWSKWLFV